VLNTDVIDRLEFMTGGYTAEYGDALSGVLKIKRRVGNLAKVRATAGISLLTANGSLEGPIGNDGKGSWLVAGRRSYIDQVLKNRAAGPTTVPAYWDIDARLYRRMGENDVRLGFLRSGDFLSARLGDTFSFAPAESSGMEWNRKLTLASLNWERLAGSWKLDQAVAYSWRDQAVELFGGLPQSAAQEQQTFDWRGDARRPSRRVTWVTGAQMTWAHTIYDLDINRLSILEPDRIGEAARQALHLVRGHRDGGRSGLAERDADALHDFLRELDDPLRGLLLLRLLLLRRLRRSSGVGRKARQRTRELGRNGGERDAGLDP
jgi:hypothetical protein